MKYTVLVSLLLLFGISINAQSLNANGAIALKANITLGNQNQWLKVGIVSFGTLNYGDISVEGGLNLFAYQFIKRHTVSRNGFAFQYETFILGGLGKNGNLLGSATAQDHHVLFDATKRGGFNGFGFAVSQDFLPKTLKSYGRRRGKAIVRLSTNDYGLHLSFANDFKFGLIRGDGTDFGETGTLIIGFTKILNSQELYTAGIGVSLFTSQPDYGKIPRNSKNSDDGRKSVWFTLPPYEDLFYSNLYTYGSYQSTQYSINTEIGLNSYKTGAFIQNKLHDGFGLNPRFPWPVENDGKPYVQLGGNIFYNSND